MTKFLYAAYSLASYACFLIVFLYLVAFIANSPLIPKTIDSGSSPFGGSPVLVDLGLIALFGIQHSVMARKTFKAWWKRIVPAPVERSTYLVFSCLALAMLFVFWAPIAQPVWQLDTPWLRITVWAIFGLGWMVLLSSTFLLDHFELFGLRQVYDYWKQRYPAAPKMREPLYYAFVRHPLYSGFLLAFWAAPTMTIGHLIFAIGMTLYVLVAIRFEERDLQETFGERYSAYRERVGMLLPRIRAR